MIARLQRFLGWLASPVRAGSRLLRATLRQNADECLTLSGVVMITIGLWPLVGQVALIVPGIVALWLGLPSRTRFVARQEIPPTKRSR